MKNLLKVFRNIVLFLGTVFLLNSCSSQDNNNKIESLTEEPSHKVDTVTINLMQFKPDTLNVKIGDTVIWINKGFVSHDITSNKLNSFYSDTIHAGQSWKMAVTDTASYHCSIHPTMLGKLVVK